MNVPRALTVDDHTAPSWIERKSQAGEVVKPLLRCNCGTLMGMALHHIHADGSVTASWLHPECGWHEYLVLDGWTGQDFPPEAP